MPVINSNHNRVHPALNMESIVEYMSRKMGQKKIKQYSIVSGRMKVERLTGQWVEVDLTKPYTEDEISYALWWAVNS